MNIVRKSARYMTKQILGILIAVGVLAGTVIGMFLAALLVALFGLFGAGFFLLAPIFGIVLREKLNGWSKGADELVEKLNEFTDAATKATNERERDSKVTPIR